MAWVSLWDGKRARELYLGDLHNFVNKLKATELYTIKWYILLYVSYIL